MGWLASADAPARAPAAGPGVPFDDLIEQVERGDVVITRPDEIRAMVRRLDALRPKADPLRELRLRGFRCDYDDLGLPASGLAFARAGLADAHRLRDVGSQIRFGLCESYFLEGDGQNELAAAAIETALGLARKHGDARLLAQSLSRRGNVRSLHGQQAAALGDFLDAQRAFHAGGLKKEAETYLHEIAVAYRRMGDHDKAMPYLRQSIAFAKRERDWRLLTVSLLQVAFVHEDQGRYDQALAVQREVAKIAAAQGFDYQLAAVGVAMASAQIGQGDHDAAALSLAAAREGFDRLGDRSNDGMLRLLEGKVMASRGDHAGALAHYLESAAAFAADPNPRYQVELYAARALSHEAVGNYRAAMDDLKVERGVRKRLSDDARTQQSLLLQYQFDTARRDLENARLQAERNSQQQRLAAVEQANRWQAVALVFGALLVALLLFVVWRQLRSTRRIRMLALTDALTGVANRRRIETAAEEAVARARAPGGDPLAVLTFDVDRFKQINDSHGHAGGDQVLVRVARACEAVLRQGDLLARPGGDEFLVLLPCTPLDAAVAIAERLREGVAALRARDPDGLRVTISIGLSMLAPGDDGIHDAIDRADAALYRAKAAGRNRTEVELHGAAPGASRAGRLESA